MAKWNINEEGNRHPIKLRKTNLESNLLFTLILSLDLRGLFGVPLVESYGILSLLGSLQGVSQAIRLTT